MLNPRKDRLDYGMHLRPPMGFDLSYAVATTYSLDLGTLLTLPIALCFGETLEGDLEGEKLALLEAVQQLKGRLKVFFQQGNLHVPLGFNRLFTLLEPCMAPVVPEGAFSSFHPKIWILRFTGPNRAVRYRLLVLSRNLTFDRSWDLAVALEGNVETEPSRENDGLADLLANLRRHGHSFQESDRLALANMAKEVPRVHWRRPPGFSRLETLLGDPQHRPLSFGRRTEALLVISPFLKLDGLEFLAEKCPNRWLFSRAEELNRIGPDGLKGWRCFALNPQVVNSEDELTKGKVQDLHAKVVVLRNGATSHWHVGSANATGAALGTDGKAPRNTEFMLRLTSSSPDQLPERLVEELAGTKEVPTGIFVPHKFPERPEPGQEDAENLARRLTYALVRADWAIQARREPGGTFRCEVSSDLEALLPSGPYVIEVGHLPTRTFKAWEPVVAWEGLGATELSAFLPLRVRQDGKKEIELIVKARFAVEGGDDREGLIMAALLNTEKKFMAYIQMLLQPKASRSEYLGADLGEGGDGWDMGPWAKLADGPLYEALLRNASRNPEQLRYIDALTRRLELAGISIPADFLRLWQHYRPFVAKGKS